MTGSSSVAGAGGSGGCPMAELSPGLVIGPSAELMTPESGSIEEGERSVSEAAAWSNDDAEVSGGAPPGEAGSVPDRDTAAAVPEHVAPANQATGDEPAGDEATGDENTGGRAYGDQATGGEAADDRAVDQDGSESRAASGRAAESGRRRWSPLAAFQHTWPPRQWPLLLVVSGIVLSLLVVILEDFRPGTVLFAGSLLLGALLRLVLPDRQAGLLVLRSRIIDVLLMLIMALIILLLALIVPDLPEGGLPAVQQ